MIAQVGQVVEFDYGRGLDGSYIVKVTGVRDTRFDPVTLKTKGRNPMPRNRYLITGRLPNGSYRSFYTDEIMSPVRVVSLAERVIMWVLGMRF
jgi:hypothetical protein